MSSMNENESPFLEKNIQQFIFAPVDLADEDFQLSNLFSHYNGYSYSNIPILTGNAGETIRFYVFTLGDQNLHSLFFHGIEMLQQEYKVSQSVGLLPGEARVVDIFPKFPGTFQFHCLVYDHLDRGMTGMISIQGEEESFSPENIQEYFLSIEEVDWDYVRLTF